MKLREQFEAWFGPNAAEGCWAKRDIWDTDQYQSPYTQTAWLAWQASRQQALEEKDEWRAMIHAPKDGTVLLTDGYTVGEGFWHDGSECYGHRGGEGWFWESDRSNLLIASNAEPIGWKPMPDPTCAIRSLTTTGDKP